MAGDGAIASRQGDALDGFEVTFDLQSPQAGQTISAGTAVEWHALVSVTGDTQGLAGYMLNLFLGPNTGPEPGPDGIWGTADDANLANIVIDQAIEAESFAVAGANGKPTVGAPASFSSLHGGPGMNAMTSYGYNAMPGTLLQMANAHLDWAPWRYKTTFPRGWTGEHTWGIGLEGRKQALLLNTTGDYELNAGWIDTTNLSPGHYVLTLVPDSRAKVLDPAVDLSVAQPGGLVLPANSVSGSVSIEFDIGE